MIDCLDKSKPIKREFGPGLLWIKDSIECLLLPEVKVQHMTTVIRGFYLPVVTGSPCRRLLFHIHRVSVIKLIRPMCLYSF